MRNNKNKKNHINYSLTLYRVKSQKKVKLKKQNTLTPKNSTWFLAALRPGGRSYYCQYICYLFPWEDYISFLCFVSGVTMWLALANEMVGSAMCHFVHSFKSEFLVSHILSLPLPWDSRRDGFVKSGSWRKGNDGVRVASKQL